MIEREVDTKQTIKSQLDVSCRRGCGKCVPKHSLEKHEEIECELIPEERRQILSQLLKEECERVYTQMQDSQNKKEKEFASVKEECDRYKDVTNFYDHGCAEVQHETDDVMNHRSDDYPPVVLELTPFSDMKDKMKTYISKPFYTHANGYKMCLVIYPNGYGQAEGSHVSVFVSIMKGKNDSKLKWPFRGILTIQLLDQSKKEDHKEVTVSYLESEHDYASRVSIGTHNAATGKLWMIAHESLCDDGGPQYLRNDCLKFRIKKFENNKPAPERINQMWYVLCFLIFAVISITLHIFYITHTHSF